MHQLARTAALLLGTQATHVESLSGGYMGPVLRVTLADGRRVIAKGGPAPPAEAEMLRAIEAAGAPAPGVLAANDEVLVIEERPDYGALHAAWAHLGAVLAKLHSSASDRYGWQHDYAFGPLAIPNRWHDDWPTFWGEQRLLAHENRLPQDVARRVHALATDLPNRLPGTPPASLLHGDMWTGNVLVDGERVSALVDPACYHGHGEVDLAMLTLFASPSEAFFEAYRPERDWRERHPVYQLWPALVHLLLFGDGYRPMVERILRQARA